MVYTKNKFKVSKEELSFAYQKLGSLQKVADEYGVSKKLILNHMKMLKIPRSLSNRETGLQQMKAIKLLAKKGFNGVQIAKEIGTMPEVIYGIAKRHKIMIVDSFHKGFTMSDSGYKLLRKPNHPQADSRGYIREHRLIMEQYLGRMLEDGECVHHVNGDRQNNSIRNLELMLIADHIKLHHTGKKGRGPDRMPRKKSSKR